MTPKKKPLTGLSDDQLADVMRRTEADKWLKKGPGRRLTAFLALMTVPLIIAHTYSIMTTGNAFNLTSTLNIPWFILAALLFCFAVIWATQREKIYALRDKRLDEVELQTETRATAWAGERLFQSYFIFFIFLLWFPKWYLALAPALPLIFAAEFIWLRWSKRIIIREELEIGN
jgi:hypothetical protein